jgi:hypothetical protein
MMRTVLAVAAMLTALDAAAGQQAPRPLRDLVPGRPAAGSGVIMGRVTAVDTGAPLRQAIVSASGLTGVMSPREALTDDQGRFVLRELEPGPWQVTVSRAGYITRKFGQSRPFGRATAITLGNGQKVNVDIPLTRASAIVGHVVDEYGEPVTAARVTVLRPTMARHQRYLEPVGDGDFTDDTGAFRLHSLPAGDYYVTASARVAPPESVVQTTMAPTYYPGTGDFGLAQKVRVGPAAEAVIDFPLLPVRTARVSGMVYTSSGEPAHAFLSLTSDTGELGASIGAGGVTREDGTFTMAEIPPGRYTLIADVRADATTIAEIGAATVVLNGTDVEGLTLTTAKPGTLRGTIALDTGVRRRLPNEIEITARPRRQGADATFVTATGPSFEMPAPPGPFTLEVTVPDGWAVKSLTMGGLDASELAVDIGTEQAVPVTVVLTDRMTDVNGTIAGTDAGGAYVVIFPSDSSNWTPRRVRSVQADVRGRFRIVGLPPGERYRAVAVRELNEGEEDDPEFLQRIQDQGTSFDLPVDGKQTLDLKVVQ